MSVTLNRRRLGALLGPALSPGPSGCRCAGRGRSRPSMSWAGLRHRRGLGPEGLREDR